MHLLLPFSGFGIFGRNILLGIIPDLCATHAVSSLIMSFVIPLTSQKISNENDCNALMGMFYCVVSLSSGAVLRKAVETSNSSLYISRFSCMYKRDLI